VTECSRGVNNLNGAVQCAVCSVRSVQLMGWNNHTIFANATLCAPSDGLVAVCQQQLGGAVLEQFRHGACEVRGCGAASVPVHHSNVWASFLISAFCHGFALQIPQYCIQWDLAVDDSLECHRELDVPSEGHKGEKRFRGAQTWKMPVPLALQSLCCTHVEK
jgi:hypothetical protein